MKIHQYVGVIVKWNDSVLLCLRNHNGSFPGMWSIPAGKVEKGESHKEAAVREFYEETDINIHSLSLSTVGVIQRKTRNGKKIKGLMTVYLLEVDDILEPDLENAIDGHEHTEWNYFRIDEISAEETGTDLYKLLKKVLK